MLPIYRIELPTPYMVGPVNAYLIASPPYTLVDPGPETDQAKEMLRQALEEHGVPLEKVERVLLTHFHSDHSGLARWVHVNSGARVYAHPYDLAKLVPGYDFLGQRLPLIKGSGIPPSLLAEILQDKDPLPAPWVPEEAAAGLADGDEIHFAGGTLRVLHLPGHATGHLCFYDPGGRTLLAGDFLLPHITPNPLLEPDPGHPARRAPSLRQYLQSLERVESLEVERVLPGHGQEMSGCRQFVVLGREHHRARLQAVLEALEGNGRLTAFELTLKLFPNLKGFEVLLGLSEVMAHLDYLEESGKVGVLEDGGVAKYFLAAAGPEGS
ncbi:MBL fold metallo-hydrolase [Desulfovirgula thermocuniculi]|uniref:MBL fold metallo-hydrolase n=1 Tax=Desulfovirgula thermocuniculi TaxID=348842 RepID=UPI0012EB3B6F|nr:MBL fold metallo-hydrolase [Desulfovirgula thermocuniculi]